MIECSVYADRGLIRLSGLVPNGVATVTRSAQGVPDTVLRNADHFTVAASGILLEDSEGPVGVPLTYRTDIAVNDRLIQQNLLPVPSFTRGAGTWVAGAGRSLITESDPTAQHSAVGHFTNNAAGYVADPAPVFVGHVDATAMTGPYTLTPTTGGGGGIVTGDWVYIVHQQEAAYNVTPAAPSGFTQILATTGTTTKLAIWRRKRGAGDGGYTVNANAGATSYATCFWVRGTTDDVPLLGPIKAFAPGIAAAVQVPGVTGINPSLIVKISAVQLSQSGAKIDAALVTGAEGSIVPYAVGNDPGTRSLLIAPEGTDTSRDSLPLTAVYSAMISDVLALQMLLPSPGALTSRVVAKAKLTTLVAAPTPYRFTGRVRFTSPKVWTWDDVLANGSWDDLLADKATWADVLATEVVIDAQIARLYAVLVNPTTGAYYNHPIQVIGIPDTNVNTWMDFVVYLPVAADIPATAELWFVHGSYSREYAMEWYLDSLGITPGEQVDRHTTLWYLDGDMTRPPNGAAALEPEGDWSTPLDDSYVEWAGTPGNSISRWVAPSQLRGTTICQIDWPADEVIPCEPVLLSDPVSSALGMWVGLLEIYELEHNISSTDSKVMNRSDPIATSQDRQWEAGVLRMLTTTLAARDRLLSIARSGRVLLLRNPDPDYPENNWYLSLKRLSESRVSPDHRVGQRIWNVPFTRVARPVGLIEASSATTWDAVASRWTWDELKAARATWLDVLTMSVD